MKITLFLALVALISPSEPASVNEKVVEFARTRLGTKVGDGECSSLAREALRYAGARRSRSSWGAALSSFDEVQPGDILEFHDVVIVQRKLRSDGVVVKLTVKSPHHFAIVARVEQRENEIQWVVLHQNAGFTRAGETGKKVVQPWTFGPAEKQSGVIKAYRPIAEKGN